MTVLSNSCKLEHVTREPFTLPAPETWDTLLPPETLLKVARGIWPLLCAYLESSPRWEHYRGHLYRTCLFRFRGAYPKLLLDVWQREALLARSLGSTLQVIPTEAEAIAFARSI